MENSRNHKIFISYRQTDDGDFTARIRDNLVTYYGRTNVFIDHDSMTSFKNFKVMIRERIEKSDAVLMVIGMQWAELLNTKTQSGEPDYVLFELETALSMGKLIAPVLIKGARMPRINEVPASLRPLLDIQSSKIDNDDFYTQIKSLIEDLELVLQENVISKAEKYFEQGKEKQSQCNHDDAIADHSKAIQLHPNYAKAYLSRGSVHNLKGDIDNAIHDYTQAINISPNATIYNARGYLYDEKGAFDNAIKDYDEAINMDKTYANAYKNRGLAYYRKKIYRQTIIDYQKYLDLGGGKQNGDQTEVEAEITRLKRLI